MIKIKQLTNSLSQLLGAIGVLTCSIIFIMEPSFPTPDKLLVFFTFVFMTFHQTFAMLKRLVPFVVVILIYESFRGIADQLNTHVNYTLPAAADKLIFGKLPTSTLQDWLWHGYVQWYDFVFYIPYMLFFVLPFALAILIWKTRVHYYWQAVTAYTILFFGAFLTFLLFPAAPPWMVSDMQLIEPITRVSSHVWAALGIHDFPSVYNHIAPNPVAAVPSLHAAASTLFAIIIFKLYGRRWGAAALSYPFLICIGIVYQGEHFVFDVAVGIAYAVIAYKLAPWVIRQAVHLSAYAAARSLKAKKLLLKRANTK